MLLREQQSCLAATFALLERAGTQIEKAVPGDQLDPFLLQGSFSCQLPPGCRVSLGAYPQLFPTAETLTFGLFELLHQEVCLPLDAGLITLFPHSPVSEDA